MTTTAYRPLTVIEQIFKDLVWTPGVLAGRLELESVAPFLNLPVIHTLETVALTELTDWLYANFILFIDVTAIKLVNDEHQAAYTDASLKLRIIGHDKGIDSKEFQEARDAAKIALSRFTQFSG